jgi:hypothetical protein
MLWVWYMCYARSNEGLVLLLQMYVCPHVNPQKHGGFSCPPLSNPTSPHLPHSLPPSLPHLSELTYPPAPHPPLPPLLLTSSRPQHPSPIRTEFRKSGTIVWFENLMSTSTPQERVACRSRRRAVRTTDSRK